MASIVDIVPSLGHAPVWLQGIGTPGYDAIDLRRPASGFERGEGAATYGSFRVKQRGAGANMSVDVTMDEGAWVRGDSVAQQGLYYTPPHSGTINVDVSAAHASLPRLDMVLLEVKDNAHDASGLNKARIYVYAGNPTSGATLDNRNGAAAQPASTLLLADVLVAAADTSITDSEIRDRRAFSTPGTVPPLLTDVDMVALAPAVGQTLVMGGSTDTGDCWLSGSNHDLRQSAALMWLPRRIVGATRIRWKYVQYTTALTGNYAIAIFDASGRLIVSTGSVAFAGTTDTFQERSEVITATTFEPGWYYVFIGVDTSNSGTVRVRGIDMHAVSGVSGTTGAPWRNMGLHATSGGVSVPTTLLSMSDVVGNEGAALNAPPVPMCALSVG